MSWVAKKFRHLGQWIIILPIIFGLLGCEGDSGNIWDGWDFGDNDPNIYVAMGDSITAGYGLDSYTEAYPALLSGMLGKTVYNSGISGSRSSYGAGAVSSVLNSYKPGYLLILYGVNDLIHDYSIDSIVTNLSTMIQTAKNSQTIPVIATLTPVFDSHSFIEDGVVELNARIRQLAAEENIYVADLEQAFNWNQAYIDSDGLHPNSQGHDLIAVTFYYILE